LKNPDEKFIDLCLRFLHTLKVSEQPNPSFKFIRSVTKSENFTMKKFSNGSYSLFEAQQHHLHSSSKETKRVGEMACLPRLSL